MEEEPLSWAVLKTELGREFQVEMGRMGKVQRWTGPAGPVIQREVCGWRLGGTDHAGLGLDPALQHFVSPRSPSPSPAPGPTAPLSRAGTGKWMSLFMKPIMLPAKQGTQQSSAAPLMGYYLCHFPPGAGAITVLDSVPSPSTPPVMFQCHAEGCVLPSSWLDLGEGALAGAGQAASHSASQRSLGPLLPVESSLFQ